MKSRFKIEEIKQRDNKNKALNNWDSSDIYINDNVNKSTNEHIIEMLKIYLKFTFILIIILFIITFLLIKIKAENLTPHCHCEPAGRSNLELKSRLLRRFAPRNDIYLEVNIKNKKLKLKEEAGR